MKLKICVIMNLKINSHKDLEIWIRSIDLVVKTYKLTSSFPEYEKFGLVNQMRRASVSVSSNIAEGSGRKSTKEYVNFLYFSVGSLAELDTQYIIAQKLNYINEIDPLLKEIKSIMLMINSIIKKLQTRI